MGRLERKWKVSNEAFVADLIEKSHKFDINRSDCSKALLSVKIRARPYSITEIATSMSICSCLSFHSSSRFSS